MVVGLLMILRPVKELEQGGSFNPIVSQCKHKSGTGSRKSREITNISWYRDQERLR